MKPSQSQSYHYICFIVFLAVGVWQLIDKNPFAFLFFICALFFLFKGIRLHKK
ncbi:hypothetical protein ABWW58_14010 [Sporolactobacillus sp. STCC-11]|uniref:hypothetical protein n=1 Tax=Sporolactobacillus caesalpiniae TaxID=3230362 RepID=UPI00339A99AB